MAAVPITQERHMVAERLARLESHVEHIQADVSELKAGLSRVDAKVDGLKDAMSKLNERMGMLRVWFLLTGAGLLAVMARGFHWI